MDTGLARPLAMWYSLDLPRTLGSMEVACRRLVRRRKNLAAGLAQMKSHSRGVAGERLSRKGPRLADIACGPRLETKNESFVHAYHVFFRSYTKDALDVVHSLAVFTTAY